MSSFTIDELCTLKRDVRADSNDLYLHCQTKNVGLTYHKADVVDSNSNGIETRIVVLLNNNEFSRVLSLTRYIFTLYDHVGHIIGISNIIMRGRTYLYRSETKPDGTRDHLLLEDLLRHLPPDSAAGTFIVQMKAWTEDVTDIPILKNITGQPFIPNAKPIIEQCKTKPITFSVGGKEIPLSAPMVNTLIKESEFFRTLIAKYEKDSTTIKLEDVGLDAKVFKRFVEFIHHKKCIYLRTSQEDATLQECCRDLLPLATKYMCEDLSRTCAECIVYITSKDSVFSDVYLLDGHYHWDDKLEIIAQLATKVRDLKPDHCDEQLKILCHEHPRLSFAFMTKFCEPHPKKD